MIFVKLTLFDPSESVDPSVWVAIDKIISMASERGLRGEFTTLYVGGANAILRVVETPEEIFDTCKEGLGLGRGAGK